MKELILIIIIIMLFSQHSVYALEIHKTNIEIDISGTVFVREMFSIDSTDIDSFFLPVSSPSDIKVYDRNGKLNYSYDAGTLTVELGENKQDYSFTVEYLSSELTSKQGKNWTFSYQFYKIKDFDRADLTLVLPPNPRLLYTSPQGVIYSEDSLIKIDFTIDPEVPVSDISVGYDFETNTQQANSGYEIYIFILIVLAIVLILLKQFKAKKQPEKKTEKTKQELSEGQKDLMKTFTENEKVIVKYLIKQKEDISQKQLALETGIPKATLSRTLKKLQTKSVIEIRDYGYTKKIILTVWFLEK